MWSTTALLAVLATIALVQAAPKGASYRETAARSPTHPKQKRSLDGIGGGSLIGRSLDGIGGGNLIERESSSLVLGGRFGRNCFLQAGGCLGKRSMKIPRISFNDEMPYDSQDINALPLERLTENNRLQNIPLLEELTMKDASRDDYLNYKK